jgi:methionyl-tRNA formyltransferase
MTATAVVFAYHDVGVRCLSVLLEHGVRVRRVITHADDPNENVFFQSVERLAAEEGLEVDMTDDPGEKLLHVAKLSPHFLFSFYYRRMLPTALLECARVGAYNMHGSLLPKYRGRAPVNWAVLRGERETGATLHEMVGKPDAGRIIDQQAVPIGENDTAGEVFGRVTDAAEVVLRRALPRLLDGSAEPREQDLAQGSYFGGRRPEDGRIDWNWTARSVHDLVRAVAPPYPGAFTTWGGRTARILRTWWGEISDSLGPAHTPGTVATHDGRAFVACGDARWLEVLEAEIDPGVPLRRPELAARLGTGTDRGETPAFGSGASRVGESDP